VKVSQYLFPSRFKSRLHISARQYARIVRKWVTNAGLDGAAYGTHSLRRTKATQIYKKTGNLRAVQLLLDADAPGEALGDDLAAVAGASLDKDVELDALKV